MGRGGGHGQTRQAVRQAGNRKALSNTASHGAGGADQRHTRPGRRGPAGSPGKEGVREASERQRVAGSPETEISTVSATYTRCYKGHKGLSWRTTGTSKMARNHTRRGTLRKARNLKEPRTPVPPHRTPVPLHRLTRKAESRPSPEQHRAPTRTAQLSSALKPGASH